MTIKKTEDKKRCVDPKFEYLIRMFSQRTGRKDAEKFCRQYDLDQTA